MFTNLWKKCVQWQTSRRRQTPRATSARPRIEALEDRITPANYNTVVSPTGVMTISRSTAGTDSLTITASPSFGEYIVSTPGGDTINLALNIFTNATPVNRIVVNTGSGDDTIVFDGTGVNGVVNLSGGLTITGGGGNKTITLKSVNILSHSATALDLSLPGNGSETTTFTDVNVSGGTTIYHPSSGNTAVTFNTSNNNAIATNSFNTLSITNGAGSDINTIKDTDFAGNVAINNGYGAAGDTNQFGGSENIFSASNNAGLLNATGNLSISTTTGQSDTEVYDYDVKGTLAVNTGVGVAGQSTANFVGIENKQTNVAVPTIGAVSIIGDGASGPNPSLTVYMGTNVSGSDYPVFVAGPLAITTGGVGAANIVLNDLNVAGATSVTLGRSSSNNTVTLQGDNAISNYAAVTITSSSASGSTYNIQTTAGTMNVTGALTFNLGNAPDTINTGLGITGILNTSGNLAVTGANGAKTLNVRDSNLGGVKTSISGNGAENFTFTDTNVIGAATITHNVGNTSVTISTSNLNTNNFSNWNSLTISNGAGADTNTINDTSFAGSVTINNGAGAAGDTAQFGGSHTVFADNLNPGLLTIHGNLVVTTASGQSDTEVTDYNVHGNVTITTGAGYSNESTGNYVGLEDNQTNAGSGTPVFGGTVTVTATADRTPSPGVTVNMGTNGNQSFPLIIHGNLGITANGSGSASIDLNDLIVSSTTTTLSTTTITLAATTGNDMVSVQGTSITSMYDNFVINSAAAGVNTFYLQDSVGALQMLGTVNLSLGIGSDTVNLGADVANVNGVAGAVVEFFSTSKINGGAGLNFIYDSTFTLFNYPGDPLILFNI